MNAIGNHGWMGITAIVVFVFAVVYAFFKKAQGAPISCSDTQAQETIRELRQWGAFLIATQGGALAVMAYFFKELHQRTPLDAELAALQGLAGMGAIILFGSSIFVATLLLGALPGFFLRLQPGTSTNNDVFHNPVFSFLPCPFVGPLTGLQYGLFAVGTVFFSSFIYLRFIGAEGVV